jgi:hypothetical protein
MMDRWLGWLADKSRGMLAAIFQIASRDWCRIRHPENEEKSFFSKIFLARSKFSVNIESR